MSNYERLDSVTDFFSGTQAEWEARTEIIPENMVIFTMDTHIMRIGDGTKTFAQLDDWIKFDEMPDQSNGNVPNILGTPPDTNDAGKIVILGSELSFVVSTTVLQDVLTAINDAMNTNATQNTLIGNLQAKADLIDLFDETNEGKLCIIKNKKYAASDYTLDELNTEISNKVEKLLGLYVNDIKFYSDAGLTNEVNSFEGGSIYYAQIEAVDENSNPITYSLSSNNLKAVITAPTTNSTGTFEITTESITITEEVTFTASCDNGASNLKTLDKAININLPFILKMATYGNESDDSYVNNLNIAIDNDGNYITAVERSMDFLIVKYDPDLSILAKKAILVNNDYGMPFSILIDDNNDIIVCGEGYDNNSNDIGFILKISNDLSTIMNYTNFYNDGVSTGIEDAVFDQNNNITVCGKVIDFNNGITGDVIVSKIDQNFNKTLTKRFSNNDVNNSLMGLNNIKMNPNNTEFYGISSKGNYQTLIHFNNDFSSIINSYKYLNGVDDLSLLNLIIDSLNNKIIIVGSLDNGSGLLLILDLADLSISNQKAYTVNNLDISFYDIKIDNDGNYIVVGNIYDTSNNSGKGIIAKINSTSLNVMSCNTYGDVSGGYTEFDNIINGVNGNIVFGITESTQISLNQDDYQMICNILSFPSGSHSGNTSLTFEAITLTPATSNITSEAVVINEVTDTSTTAVLVPTLSNVDDTYQSDTIYL